MTVNARTDPDSGLRVYTWQNVDYLSVTSVRKLLGMPHALHQWALTKSIERAVTEYEALGAMLARPPKPRERLRDANVLKEAKVWLRAASTEERDAAADRGTSVHEAVALGKSPTDTSLSPEVVPYLRQWEHAKQALGIEVRASERQVFSVKLMYAGTLDLIAFVTYMNRLFLLDVKATKGLYLDHAVQLVAYAMGDFIGENDIVDHAATDLLHQVDGLGLLHLTPTGWQMVEIEPTAELFDAFTGSLAFARFLWNNHEVIDGLIKGQHGGAAPLNGASND